MPWQLRLHENAAFVETTYTGYVPLAALSTALQETLTLAERYHCQRLLRDCTALENQLSLSDLYFLMDTFDTHRPRCAWKEAVLLREPLDMGLARFRETTASNRGHQVRCFDQRQPAIAWLLAD